MRRITRHRGFLFLVTLFIVFQPLSVLANDVIHTQQTPILTASSTDSYGYYTIIARVPKEFKGSTVNVYEDNELVDSSVISPNMEIDTVLYFPFKAKAQGSYKYVCEVVDGSKTISSSEIIVNVLARKSSKATGIPEQPMLSQSNWDGSKDYSISMNMWWGDNGYAWLLYENGELIYSADLIDDTPLGQSASVSFTDKLGGTYKYKCELVNQYGAISSDELEYVVARGDTEEGDKDLPLPDKVKDVPAYGYVVDSETDSSFEWIFYVSNPNKEYVWNGTCFDIWSMSFQTTSDITEVDGAQSHVRKGNTITLYLKNHERVLNQGETVTFIVKGNKKGDMPEPQNIQVQMMRGDVPYPEYDSLPSSWYKGKNDLQISDLIKDPESYYDPNVQPGTNDIIVYNPVSDTQLIIAEPREVDYPINGVDGLRMWVPSRYVAMGLGFVQEVFKINPHYMTALGTKENFTFGLAPASSGYAENPVIVDGEKWYWPIQPRHPDGPFQQESGNFNEIKNQYPDYIDESAAHADYVTLDTGLEDDSKYVTAAISSAISLTMTREFLYSIPKLKLNDFFEQARDPLAEFSCINFAYNRGAYGFLQLNIFTVHRERALATDNIGEEFGLSGFASHLENVRAMLEASNNETTHIYDAELTWEDILEFLDKLRMFYKKDVPNDETWAKMTDDMNRAFNLLAQHWGGETISLRYDFLTLIRIAKAYLPSPMTPNPAGQTWADQVGSANAGLPDPVEDSGVEPRPEPAKLTVTDQTDEGSFVINVSILANNIATLMKLYENGEVIQTRELMADTDAEQVFSFPFYDKEPGIYSYKCELFSDNSSSISNIVKVKVRDDSEGPTDPEDPKESEEPENPEEPPGETWTRDKIYRGGDRVSWNGSIWEAKWWTQGEEPGTTGEWGAWKKIDDLKDPEEPELPIDPNYPTWDRTQVYIGRDRVSWNGYIWEAKWWTQGEEPGTIGEASVWKRIK